MIKHIVMWQLLDNAEGKTNSENATIMVEKFNMLKSVIKEVKDLYVGITIKDCPFSNYDIVLEVTFDDYKGLEAYQSHPEHVAFASGFVKKVVKSRACVDYSI